jgi:hypothetical protein
MLFDTEFYVDNRKQLYRYRIFKVQGFLSTRVGLLNQMKLNRNTVR